MAPASPAASAILNQAHTPVLTGAYEICVPAELGRIYFADHPRHVLEVLEVLVGLEFGAARQRDPQGRHLARRGAEAAAPGLVLVGARGEALVSLKRERPQPCFAIGQWVHFFGLSTRYRVVGVALFEDARRLGQTTWAYYYAGAVGAGRPIAEPQTSASQRTCAEKGPSD